MENILTDYYLHPEQVHQFIAALCELYLKYLQRQCVNSTWMVWTSDDRSPDTTLHAPGNLQRVSQTLLCAYRRILRAQVHWLHSCGNNTALLDDLIKQACSAHQFERDNG
jgi:hypothetical protein